jgi:hypothetical protein
MKPDPDLHQSKKNPDRDPQQSQKQDPDPDEAQNRAVGGL